MNNALIFIASVLSGYLLAKLLWFFFLRKKDVLRRFKVGDKISMGSFKSDMKVEGIVKSVSWCDTTVRDSKGGVMFVPHSVTESMAVVILDRVKK